MGRVAGCDFVAQVVLKVGRIEGGSDLSAGYVLGCYEGL